MKQEFTIYIGLAGTLIGASVTLAAQFLSSNLTTKREQNKLKRELLAEERCLAYLLTECYKVYIDEIILSKSFVRLATISFDAQTDNHDFYKSANEALDRAEKLENEIRITTATYLKVITHFTNLTKRREIINELFNQLNNFEKPQPSKFSEIETVSKLGDARKNEVVKLQEVYKFFPNIYDKISEEMRKSIK